MNIETNTNKVIIKLKRASRQESNIYVLKNAFFICIKIIDNKNPIVFQIQNGKNRHNNSYNNATETFLKQNKSIEIHYILQYPHIHREKFVKQS